MAAFITQKQDIKKNNTLASIGLMAIIFSIFYYDHSTPFPSIYTLVPVLGVVLLILYANNQTFISKILSSKGFVGIGLISYSAYLWHQPLFAFTKIRIQDYPFSKELVMLMLAIISLVLGQFSYRYIEKPFRNQKITSKKLIFYIISINICLFLTLGSLGSINNGFRER